MTARMAQILGLWGMGAVIGAGVGTGVGCGPSDSAVSAASPAASSEEAGEGAGEEAISPMAAPRPRLQDLGRGARRMKVIVLPGDAAVEVDGVPVQRRNGVIELVGRVGETHRLRLFQGSHTLEQSVAIQEAGGAPPVLDLLARPAGVPGGVRVGGSGGPGVNPVLFPEAFHAVRPR